MSNDSTSAESTFGYLSMLESPEHGFFGGYLIISLLGRPLEFHCTAPIRPSRAQRILYGPTLEPYLLGEQIAAALLDAAKLTPSLILADREATLHARHRSNVPILLICGSSDHSSEPVPLTRDATPDSNASTAPGGNTALSAESSRTLTAGSYSFQVPLGYELEGDEAARLLGELSRQVDLAEPFRRIEEAIREAQRLGGRDVDTHDQAA